MEKVIQPEINIGLVGHVDHGKTTLTQNLSGKWTDEHSEEIKRGITIKLGYADASFYKCEKCKEYTSKEKCKCGEKGKFLRKVSFIDAPGHESLMATMLAGASIMDAALFIIAANEPCPQLQTKEHLMALEISGIKNIVIVQNKIDTVSKEENIKNYEEIKKFIKNSIAEKALIIPISAQHGININILIEAIEEELKTPKRDLKKDPLFFVARSFDVNRPGTKIKDLKGGVLGGALVQGKLKVNDEIAIRPGRKVEEKNRLIWEEITTKISDLKTGGESVKEVKPGGSIGILTELDPSIVKSDSLNGSLVSLKGKLPDTLYSLKLKVHLLEKVIGADKEFKVDAIKKLETLVLNVNSSTTVGVVDKLSKDLIELNLKIPICVFKGSRVAISRKIGQRWGLIGYGEIV